MTELVVTPGVTIRPMAVGSVALVGDAVPLVVGSVEERILAMCARPSDRGELIDLLGESYGVDRTEADDAIQQLVAAGLLRPI